MGLAAKVLINTLNMTEEQWHFWRRKGVGGSDVAKIAGLSKWGNKITVLMEKLGEKETDEAGEAAYWGNVMEPILAQEFTRRTGMKVRRVNGILQNPDPELYFMIANVDRVLVGQDEGLELKTASEYLKDDWEGDEVPDAYYLQCQHYMAVTGFSRWWIAALVGGNKFWYKSVERDEPTIEALIKMEREFWNHVENGTIPEIDGSEVTTNYIKSKYPEAQVGTGIDLPSDAAALIDARAYWKEQAGIAEEHQREAENKLKDMLGEAETGYIDDVRVIWKNVSSNRFDSTRFKKEHPDLYVQYAKESTSRRFEIR